LIDFDRDYKNSDNLHIGVTSSTGIVYEYDMNGLQMNKTRDWTRCLTIRDLKKAGDDRRGGSSKLLASWDQYWDFTLQIVSGQNCWGKDQ